MNLQNAMWACADLVVSSCYNAFSHVDMRVEIKIPGSLEAYCIDEAGNKRVTTELLWLEAFLCSVLRAYAYADDGSGSSTKKVVGVRRFNPITNTEMEHKFLDAADKLFFNGSHSTFSPLCCMLLLKNK